MKKKLLIAFLGACMIVAAVFGLTACSKVQEALLKAPENIAYDGTYITWDKVSDAEYYYVQIGEGEPQRSNSTTFYYEANGTVFDVTVSSVLGETQESASVTFKPLAAVSNITVENDGAVKWDGVQGATAYRLNVNGNILPTDVTDTRYAELSEGSNRVKIRPIVSGDNTFYSSWSEEVSVFIYSAPTSIKYDGTDITWQGNASSYEVNINGKIEKVNANKLAYSSENRDFTVTIKALGNYTSTYDSKTATEDYHYLPTVPELKVESGIVVWNPIDRAEGYHVRVNGIDQGTVTECAFEKIAAGRSQTIQVMPYNNSGNYFSSWSPIKNVYILETPVVRWNNDLILDGDANNNFIWDAVNGAAGYTVRVSKDGGTPTEEPITADQLFYANAYLEVGKYTVQVKANAEAGSADYYDSQYSTLFTIERLPAPKQANEYIVSDPNSLAAGFTVNFLDVANASGYILYKEGAEDDRVGRGKPSFTVTDIVEGNQFEATQYSYSVGSLGTYNRANNYVTLNSLTKSGLSFTITVQAVPQNLTMSGYTLSWDPVSGSNGYAVTDGGTATTANSNTLDLSTISAGDHTVNVCARGNGENILASSLSAPVRIIRLEAPENIRILSDENGTLDCDHDSTYGLSVYLDLSNEPIPKQEKYTNMYNRIDTDGTQLSVTADANTYNSDKTVYYMTSQRSQTQQFVRLLAPEFPEAAILNSVQLIWNRPGNINGDEYTPTYEVYYNPTTPAPGGQRNANYFDISYLTAGSHTFYVKAIGNDSKYLDSELSTMITVTKLATPQLRIENNQYVWDALTGDEANSYYLEIDGERVHQVTHVSNKTYTYKPNYTSLGNHTVKLTAIGDGRLTVNSNDCVYIQKVEKLSAPTITAKYSGSEFVKGGTIDVEVHKKIDNSTGYRYSIVNGGADEIGTEKHSFAIGTPGVYTIKVVAMGGSIVDEIYYLDSSDSNTQTIHLLSAPSNTSFRLNTSGQFMWDRVSNPGIGYEYQISFDGGNTWGSFDGDTYTAGTIGKTQGSSVKVSVAVLKEMGTTWKLRVRTLGNGSSSITSEWSESTENPITLA